MIAFFNKKVVRKIWLVMILLVFIVSSSIAVFALYTSQKDIIGTVKSGAITNIAINMSEYNAGGDIAVDSSTVGYDAGVLTCYATKRTSDNTADYMQLCNLKATVGYSATLNTRLRVKIQEVWISEKVYANNKIVPTIISKKSNTNYFVFEENWTYDESTGYAYYSEMISKSDSISVPFITNGSFYYTTTSGIGYRETIYIQVQFQIETVQSNRAKKVWGVNF